jgi:hypothetical protein
MTLPISETTDPKITATQALSGPNGPIRNKRNEATEILIPCSKN